MKQWTPRCSKRIKEIYDNLPEKGNAFLETRLNPFYERVRHIRLEDRDSFLQNLMSKLKPQIPKEKAEYQVNFKPTKENAKKIEYLKEKLGLTDSELFEVLVLMDTLSEVAPIEPLVEERKEAPQITEAKRLEEKPPQTRQEEIIKDLLANRCHTKYVDCSSEPFKDKDEVWKIDCPKQIWKKMRARAKFYGFISIEECRSLHKTTMRYANRLKERETKTKTKQNKEDLEAPQLLIREKPELSITEIVDRLGVCENPFLMRDRNLLCHVCKKRDPEKWQACQENQKELENSPIAWRNYRNSRIERNREQREARENPYWWWRSPKTEDMTLEEIEEDLGLRSNPLSYEDLKFDAFRKRYHEKCETCEEHRHHRCARYCREFLNELELPQEQAS